MSLTHVQILKRNWRCWGTSWRYQSLWDYTTEWPTVTKVTCNMERRSHIKFALYTVLNYSHYMDFMKVAYIWLSTQVFSLIYTHAVSVDIHVYHMYEGMHVSYMYSQKWPAPFIKPPSEHVYIGALSNPSSSCLHLPRPFKLTYVKPITAGYTQWLYD